MPCACAEEICRSGSISKNHQLTNLNKCGKFHACIRNSTILALSRLANLCQSVLSHKNEYFILYYLLFMILPYQLIMNDHHSWATLLSKELIVITFCEHFNISMPVYDNHPSIIPNQSAYQFVLTINIGSTNSYLHQFI